MKRPVIRYSEAFKMQVVEDVEKGRYRSAGEAGKAYGIGGGQTVSRWLREYGKQHLLRKVIRVEKPDEPGEMRRLKERIRKLEEALADVHMDHSLEKAYFKLLCEKTKTDGEAFKKKANGQQSMEPKKSIPRKR